MIGIFCLILRHSEEMEEMNWRRWRSSRLDVRKYSAREPWMNLFTNFQNSCLQNIVHRCFVQLNVDIKLVKIDKLYPYESKCIGKIIIGLSRSKATRFNFTALFRVEPKDRLRFQQCGISQWLTHGSFHIKSSTVVCVCYQFQVKVHDLPEGVGTSGRGSSALRFLSTHQLKVGGCWGYLYASDCVS